MERDSVLRQRRASFLAALPGWCRQSVRQSVIVLHARMGCADGGVVALSLLMGNLKSKLM